MGLNEALRVMAFSGLVACSPESIGLSDSRSPLDEYDTAADTASETGVPPEDTGGESADTAETADTADTADTAPVLEQTLESNAELCAVLWDSSLDDVSERVSQNPTIEPTLSATGVLEDRFLVEHANTGLPLPIFACSNANYPRGVAFGGATVAQDFQNNSLAAAAYFEEDQLRFARTTAVSLKFGVLQPGAEVVTEENFVGWMPTPEGDAFVYTLTMNGEVVQASR